MDDEPFVEDRMIPAYDLPLTQCKHRYVICTYPRSGSTLVSEALRLTQKAGVPSEYLNVRELAAYRKRFNVSDPAVREYIEFIENHRTSDNGVFGMKLHLRHLTRFSSIAARRAFLKRFDRYVMVERRDVVSQAISLVRAGTTGVWNTTDQKSLEIARNALLRYDARVIAYWVHQIVSARSEWSALLSEFEDAVLTIFYEDLVTDFAATMNSVASHIGIVDFDRSVFDRPRLLKISGSADLEWKTRFLKEISNG